MTAPLPSKGTVRAPDVSSGFGRRGGSEDTIRVEGRPHFTSGQGSSNWAILILLCWNQSGAPQATSEKRERRRRNGTGGQITDQKQTRFLRALGTILAALLLE